MGGAFPAGRWPVGCAGRFTGLIPDGFCAGFFVGCLTGFLTGIFVGDGLEPAGDPSGFWSELGCGCGCGCGCGLGWGRGVGLGWGCECGLGCGLRCGLGCGAGANARAPAARITASKPLCSGEAVDVAVASAQDSRLRTASGLTRFAPAPLRSSPSATTAAVEVASSATPANTAHQQLEEVEVGFHRGASSAAKCITPHSNWSAFGKLMGRNIEREAGT